MKKNSVKYNNYVDILKKELIPSMGCTEPIAIAYCAAKAQSILKKKPDTVIIDVSGNIIKNAKSVVVPNTNGLKGIDAAASIGIVAGDVSLGLQVISNVTAKQVDDLHNFLQTTNIIVNTADNGFALDISVKLISKQESAIVRILNGHTNIVYIEHNNIILLKKSLLNSLEYKKENYDFMNMKDIYDFTVSVDVSVLEAIISKQIEFNTLISVEGLSKPYGANIGSTILKSHGDGVRNRAKSKTAAGSDARMNGCELPVIINSGSGNQGMTTSLPVIEFAHELNVDKEKLYKALILSNLISIYQKSKIGSLSAFCGAVSAGAAAGAAITYLKNGDFDDVSHTLINALAITSGIICDGAKASCAAKIAISVDAGILASDMHFNRQDFYAGDGIIGIGVENTINNVGVLGSSGMKQTDKDILCMMTCFD